MVSVSCFEVGFCESNVCFRGVVVVPCDGDIYIINTWVLLPASVSFLTCIKGHVLKHRR